MTQEQELFNLPDDTILNETDALKLARLTALGLKRMNDAYGDFRKYQRMCWVNAWTIRGLSLALAVMAYALAGHLHIAIK